MSITESKDRFSIPDAPINQSEVVPPRDQIIEDFRQHNTSFECYRFLHEMFHFYLQHGGLKYKSEKETGMAYQHFRAISDALYSLEKHAHDFEAGSYVLQYLEVVKAADKDEIHSAVKFMEKLTNKYGSLYCGLWSLIDHYEKLPGRLKKPLMNKKLLYKKSKAPAAGAVATAWLPQLSNKWIKPPGDFHPWGLFKSHFQFQHNVYK